MPPETFKRITWKKALQEGEKRIRQQFLDALIQTNPRTRKGLLAQRESIYAQMHEALAEENAQRAAFVFRKQLKLMSTLQRERAHA